MYELKCSCGSVYNGKTKRKSSVDQQSTNKKASKVTGHPLKQPNTERNATAISTGYTPKLSPWKIGIMIGKWGSHWRLIWRWSSMDKIKCWTKTMGTLLGQMRGNLYLKKWKYYIEIWRHFVLNDDLALYFHQFENGFNQCGRNITFWIIKLL